MAALKTEINTPNMERRIRDTANVFPAIVFGGHDSHRIGTDFEHGQWWVTCLDCGAAWSVVDAIGGSAVDGFDFERVVEGDGSCEEG